MTTRPDTMTGDDDDDLEGMTSNVSAMMTMTTKTLWNNSDNDGAMAGYHRQR
jgi:hypothetical protein